MSFPNIPQAEPVPSQKSTEEANIPLPPGWIAIPLPNGGFVYQNRANPLPVLTSPPDRVALLEQKIQELLNREWESDWLSAHSTSTNIVTLTHNRDAYPKRGITVLFSPTNPPDVVYDVSSSNYCAHHNGCNSAFHTGTFEYGLNYVKVPLWDGGFVGRHWNGEKWLTWKSGFLKFIIHF